MRKSIFGRDGSNSKQEKFLFCFNNTKNLFLTGWKNLISSLVIILYCKISFVYNFFNFKNFLFRFYCFRTIYFADLGKETAFPFHRRDFAINFLQPPTKFLLLSLSFSKTLRKYFLQYWESCLWKFFWACRTRQSITFTMVCFAAAVLRRRPGGRPHARPHAAAARIPGPRERPERPRHAQQTRRPRELQQRRPRRPRGEMGRRRRIQLQRWRQHSRFQHHYNNNNNNNNNNNITHRHRHTLSYPFNSWKFTESCSAACRWGTIVWHASNAPDWPRPATPSCSMRSLGGFRLRYLLFAAVDFWRFIISWWTRCGGLGGVWEGCDLWLIRLSVFRGGIEEVCAR